jgi:Iron-sulfur cluster-binding domain
MNDAAAKIDEPPALRRVRDGFTRDCFYPWDSIFIHADRSVRVCCTSAVIDTIGLGWDVEALVNGPSFRRFRKDFLEGQLTVECHDCPIRPEIPLEEFKGKLTDYLQDKMDEKALETRPSAGLKMRLRAKRIRRRLKQAFGRA